MVILYFCPDGGRSNEVLLYTWTYSHSGRGSVDASAGCVKFSSGLGAVLGTAVGGIGDGGLVASREGVVLDVGAAIGGGAGGVITLDLGS